MLILGIETSCDETAVALVHDGWRCVANDVASQVKLHAAFGGVVPETASRAHLRWLLPMIDATMDRCGVTWDDIDAVAVTRGPGLVGALLVGVETAKALAWARRKPLIAVHHVAAHLHSPFVSAADGSYRLITLGGDDDAVTGPGAGIAATETVMAIPAPDGDTLPAPPLRYPYVGLAVSGGHTSLVRVDAPDRMTVMAETLDDAAGEAFDKFAKIIGLGYPGGPLVEATARGGDPARFALPRPKLAGSANGRPGALDFSFSGLKTAAATVLRGLGGPDALAADPALRADLCASFQEAVCETLLRKAAVALALTDTPGAPPTQLAVVGGVACNGRLREAVSRYLPGRTVVFPPPELCTDNAAMIAGLAYHLRGAGGCDLTLDADPGMEFPAVPVAAAAAID